MNLYVYMYFNVCDIVQHILIIDIYGYYEIIQYPCAKGWDGHQRSGS
jgi:hypothetical protein